MLPEYMVHEEYPQQDDNEYSPPRLPYGYDRTTVYEREGQQVTDKTVKVSNLQLKINDFLLQSLAMLMVVT